MLPEDGELELGPVSLGRGRRVVAGGDSRDPAEPVAWVTEQSLPDAGTAWRELSGTLLHSATGGQVFATWVNIW